MEHNYDIFSDENNLNSQQSVHHAPDSRANLQSEVQSQQPAASVPNKKDAVAYDPVLNLPVYQSAIKTDWFKRGEDRIWYFVRTDANNISKPMSLFQFNIFTVITVDQDFFGRFKYLIIKYGNISSSNMCAVIPFEKFMKKKLQEFFIIPAGFRIPNAKDNVINEFLFYLIMNCEKQDTISSFPYQGWHFGKYRRLIFECEDRYEEGFRSYLLPSTLKRSNAVPYTWGEHYLDKISTVLPNDWKVKFIVALRVASLMLKLSYECRLYPKQLFIFESTIDSNTMLLSAMLKTNNDNDNDLLSLASPQNQLMSSVAEISDGIAAIYDFSSTIGSRTSSMSLSYLSDHLIKNSHIISSSKQLIAIVSQFAQYDIDPEKCYTINLDRGELSYKYDEVRELLTEIDTAVISHFNGRTVEDAISEYAKHLTEQEKKIIAPLPREIKDTYLMINCAMAIFNGILDPRSQLEGFFPYHPYFDKSNIAIINKFLLYIDRSGQNKMKSIIEGFVNILNLAFTHYFKCIPIAQYISGDITDEVVLTDDEYIYISTAAVDTIIKDMRINISHRHLIKALVSDGIITGDYHNCCRIQYIDVFSKSHQIYRYRISRSILSNESQAVIEKAVNSEFFHNLSDVKSSRFLPLTIDESTNTWAGRMIEQGSNNHMIITGESGSGKSYMMLRTAAYLAEIGERVIILDSSDSNTNYELCRALSRRFVKGNIKIYNLNEQKFPVDPFSLKELKRKDSKANYLFDILSSAVYDATAAQKAKLKSLLFENIESLEIDGRVSPESIKKLLVNDGSIISALRDKLLPLLDLER